MLALLPILVLVAIVGSDAWVYVDAKRRADQGAPVSVAIGSLHVETPEDWGVACLVLWLIFFPLYLTART